MSYSNCRKNPTKLIDKETDNKEDFFFIIIMIKKNGTDSS